MKAQTFLWVFNGDISRYTETGEVITRRHVNTFHRPTWESDNAIVIIIKVNYNYHKNYPRILCGNFLKSFITLIIFT